MHASSRVVLGFLVVILLSLYIVPLIMGQVGWLGIVDLVWKGAVLWVLWEIRDRLPRRS